MPSDVPARSRPKGAVERASAVADAFPGPGPWTDEATDGRRLTIERLDRSGGRITAAVSLVDADGAPVPIDPERMVVNPPAYICGADRRRVMDPAAALWTVLWQSVDTHPGKPPRT